MSKDKYFREELAFLREQGKEFAQVYPQLTRYLNAPSRDPDVERLLEGFAFLSGRLREKIDDEFPELTHSILAMLWPNYLRPIPSMTIMQFTPHNDIVTQGQTVKKGTLIHSDPIDGVICKFQTCRDIHVYPFQREHVRAMHTRNASLIDIQIKLDTISLEDSVLFESLRFFLDGERYSVQMLYLWLNQYLDDVELIIGSDEKNKIRLPKNCLRAVGFDNEQGLLPYPKNVYEGYRIIQEYLCYEQAFHFIDLFNLARVSLPTKERHFTIRFNFSRSLPDDVQINNQSFKLFCTPAINLFSHDAEPINLSGEQAEYKISASNFYPAGYEIFSVNRVEGWSNEQYRPNQTQRRRRVYTPFESFQHEIELIRQRKALYYRIRMREGIRQPGFEHFISFVRSDEKQLVNIKETVSLNLTCTNRLLPLELGIGDVSVETSMTPSFADFTNITQPTAPQHPVLDGTLLWSLISNLSLNYLSLLSRDAIVSILRVYDFKALRDRQAEQISRQRLNGILKIESSPLEKILNGMPVRGLRSVLTLSQSAFGSEGDLYLFGSVLSHFFSLYASINSFHELVVINADNQERYTWKVQTGTQPLI